MESEATKPKPLQGTSPGERAAAERSPQKVEADPGATPPPAVQEQIAPVLKVFRSAISSLEQAALRRLFDLLAASVPAHNTEGQTTVETQNPQSPVSAATQDELLKLLASSDFQSAVRTAAKVTRNFVDTLCRALGLQKDPPTQQAAESLLRLLANLSHEPDPPLLAQNSSKHPNELLRLQQANPEDGQEKILIETFLSRRGELVNAKTQLLRLLESLNSKMYSPAPNPLALNQQLQNASADYLKFLLENAGFKLTALAQSPPDHLSLLLSTSGLGQWPVSVDVEKDLSQEAQILKALVINDALSKLIQLSEGGSSRELTINSKDEIYLKDLIKVLLKYKIRNETGTSHESVSVAPSTSLQPSSELEANADTIAKLLQAQLGSESLKAEASGALPAKLLATSPSAKVLFTTIVRLLTDLGSKVESKPEQAISEISELAQLSLRVAIETRSASVFLNTNDFLRNMLGAKDMVGALSSLVLGFCKEIESDRPEDNPQWTQLNQKVQEQVEKFKYLTSRNPAARREALATLTSNLQASLQEYSSKEPIDRRTLDAKLLESLSQDSLQRLNNLANRLEQPQFSPFATTPYGPPTSELSVRVSHTNEDLDESDKATARAGIEKIECSVMLPNIGLCGIGISLMGESVALRIDHASQAVIEIGNQSLKELDSRLKDLGYEQRTVKLQCKEPVPAKPGWMLEILGCSKKS